MTEERRRAVVRANFRALWVFLPLLALPGVMLVLQTVLSRSPSAAGFVFFGLNAMVMGLLLVFAYVWIPRRAEQQRIVFGEGRYAVTTWFGTSRFAASDVAGVVAVDRLSLGGVPPAHHLVLAGHRRRLLLLAGHMWDVEQLRALADDLAARGVPFAHLDRPVAPHELRAMDPRLMPWRQARPIAFALLLVLGVLLLCVLVVAMMLALL